MKNQQDPDRSGDDMNEMPLNRTILRLDHQSSDRMLDGVVDADDAAPGYGPVVGLLRQARSGADTSVSERELATVAAMRDVLFGRVVPVRDHARKKPMRSKIIAPKVAIAAGAIVLGAGTAAAAVSGTLLPSHASPKAGTTTGVGIASTAGPAASSWGDQGTANPQPPNAATSATPSGSAPATPSPNATFGLCTAFLAGSPSSATGKDGSTAFQALMASHGGTVASTMTFCQTFLSANHPGNSSGALNSGANPSPGSDEPANSHAPVPAPNSGGSAPPDTGNGGASDHGTSMPPGVSAGAGANGASGSGSAESSAHGSH